MRYKIAHETNYQFSSEVFFEPHYLRFKPKNSPHIKLLNFELEIFPKPAGISEHIDSEGNLVTLCWFENLNKSLHLRSETLVNLHEHNPFNFLIYPQNFFGLPFNYDDSLKSLLQLSLINYDITTPLKDYGSIILNNSNNKTIEFLTNLTKQIHDDFTLVVRETGAPYKPGKTFELKCGSCRDLAWMHINLLRHFGIAARFVSGYYYIEMEKPDYELHAWVEVYLPGAGWIGLDPSHGILVGNSHIPVAASSLSENTMSVTGSIRGNASSHLSTNLSIEVI